jgi:hypothetical protein
VSTADAIIAGHTTHLREHERRITATEVKLEAVEDQVTAIRISLARVAGAAAAGGIGGGGVFTLLARVLGH